MIYQFDIFAVNWLNSWIFFAPWLDAAIAFFASYLEWWVLAGLLAFGAFAFLDKFAGIRKKNFTIIAEALGVAVVARFGVAELIRIFYHRLRPFEVLPDLHHLLTRDGGGSFPSGHATFYFTVATVIAYYYPKTSIIFFLAALGISAARVTIGFHWPSDIVGGAAVGIAVGLLCEWALRKYRQSKAAV